MAQTIKTTIELDLNQFKQQLVEAANQAGLSQSKIKSLLSDLKIKVNDSEINSSFKKVADAAKKTADDVEKAFSGKSLGARLFDVNQINQATSQIASSVSKLTQPFNEVDKLSRNVGTLGVKNWKELQDVVVNLQKDKGKDSATWLNAFYNSISAGAIAVKDGMVDTKKGVDFLMKADDLAKAGMIDTNTAAQTLASIVNSYGGQFEKTAEYSNIMFGAVKLGKTTVNELAGSLYNVTGTASQFGVSFKEVVSSIATMTKQGVPTAQATTQIRQAIAELSKPSADLAVVMSKAGVSLQSLKQEGLIASMQKINATAKSMGKEITQVFSSVEAGSAAAKLTNVVNGVVLAQQDLKDMDAAALDSTNQAARLMEGGIEYQVNRLGKRLKGYIIDLGSLAGVPLSIAAQSLPAIQSTAMTLSSIKNLVPTETWKNATTTIKNTFNNATGYISSFASKSMNYLKPMTDGLSNMFMPLVNSTKNIASSIISNLIPSLTATGAAAGGTSTIFSAMWTAATGPIGLVVAGIAAVGGAIYLAYNNIATFKNFVDELWQVVKVTFVGAWEVIKSVGNILYQVGNVIFQWLIAPFRTLWSIATTVFNAISKAFNFGQGQKFSFAETVQNFFNWITSNLDGFANFIQSVGDGISKVANVIGIIIGEWLAPIVIDSIKAIINIFSWLWNDILTPIGNWIKDKFVAAWDFLVNSIKIVWNWITGLGDKFLNFFNSIKGKFAFLGTIFEPLKSAFDSVYNWISDKLNIIGNFVSGIINKVKGLLGKDVKVEANAEVNAKVDTKIEKSDAVIKAYLDKINDFKRRLEDGTLTALNLKNEMGKKQLNDSLNRIYTEAFQNAKLDGKTDNEAKKSAELIKKQAQDKYDEIANAFKKKKGGAKDKIDLGLELAKIDEAIINDTNKKISEFSKKSIENRINDIEDYKNKVLAIENITESERLKLIQNSDQEILRLKRESANNDIVIKANDDLVKNQEKVIEVFAKRNDIKEIKSTLENYQKAINSIKSNEYLTELEKSQQIKTLTTQTYDDLGNIAKNHKLVNNKELDKLQNDLNKNIEISNNNLNQNLKNSNDKFDKDSEKSRLDYTKKSVQAIYNERKAEIDALLKLQITSNQKEAQQKQSLQKESLKLEYEYDLSTKQYSDAEKLAKQKEYYEKLSVIDLEYFKTLSNLTLDENEAQYQNRLLDIDKNYKDELKIVGDNLTLKNKAITKKNKENYDALKDYLKKESSLYSSTFVFVEELQKQFSEETQKQNEDDTIKKKEELDKQAKDYENMYFKNEITYKQYQEKFQELEKQKLELEKQTQDKRFDYISKINAALTKQFEALTNKAQETLQNTMNKSAALFNDLMQSEKKYNKEREDVNSQYADDEATRNEAISQINQQQAKDKKKNAEEQTKTLTQMGEESLALVALTGTQALVTGKNALKEMAKMGIQQMENMLITYVPIIFTKSIEWLGPILGPIAAGGLIGTAIGLGELAKAKIQGAYEGYMPGKKRKRSDKHPLDTELTWTNPNEPIIPIYMANREDDVLNAWFDGKSTKEYVKDNLGKFVNLKELSNSFVGTSLNKEAIQNINEHVTRPFSYQTYQNVTNINNHIYNNTNLHQDNRLKQRQALEVSFTPLRADGNDLVAITKRITKNEIKGW